MTHSNKRKHIKYSKLLNIFKLSPETVETKQTTEKHHLKFITSGN
jgi:hypothetical protein